MNKEIELKEKRILNILTGLQSTLYFLVVMYFWGEIQASWLVSLFIVLSVINLVTVKYLKVPIIFYTVSILQLILAFLIIYVSGNVYSPFYPMYYLPVIASVAISSETLNLLKIFLFSLLASLLTFINIIMMPTIEFTEVIRGGVIAISYFVLGYCVMFHQFRLKETLFHVQTDYLTGVYNKYAGEKYVKEAIQQSKEKNYPISIAFCDIDEFKKVNDKYGHLCGDQILKDVATIIRNTMTSDTIIVRWGGEEFLLLIKSPKLQALQVMDALREKVESTSFNYKNTSIPITISGGIVEAEDFNHEILEVIFEADKLLYKAKDLGRNRIEIQEKGA